MSNLTILTKEKEIECTEAISFSLNKMLEIAFQHKDIMEDMRDLFDSLKENDVLDYSDVFNIYAETDIKRIKETINHLCSLYDEGGSTDDFVKGCIDLNFNYTHTNEIINNYRFYEENIPDIFKYWENVRNKAKEVLIKNNIRLVHSIAKNYASQGLEYDDFVQEGCKGLMHAADSNDSKRGLRFSTYATKWIRKTIGEALVDKSSLVQLTQVMHLRIRIIYKFKEDWYVKHGKYPLIEDIAEGLNLATDQVELALQAMTFSNIASIDAKINEDSKGIIGDKIESHLLMSAIDRSSYKDLKKNINNVLSSLTEREKKIVIKHLGLDGTEGLSFRDIKSYESMKISNEAIRLIYNGALKKLKSKSNLELLSPWKDDVEYG